MKIVLIGFMCSGKSKVGRLLSKKLGWPHYDTDEIIVREEGDSIAHIIQKQGEERFREMERKTVLSLVSLDQCVISTGGGIPLNPLNMKDLAQNSLVVWLKVSPQVVLKRAGDLKSRPLLDPNNPLQSIKTRLLERDQAYAKAHQVVDTDSMDPDKIIEKILLSLPQVSS